jgi:hypothetical protein
MKSFISLVFFSLSFTVTAQIPSGTKEVPDIFKLFSGTSVKQGSLTIIQDEQLKVLVNRYVEVRRKDMRIPGFRIRIFSNSGQTARQKAYSERERFIKLFPEMPSPVVEYETPNFKVYTGGFRSKLEAFRSYKLIMKEFRFAFLVPAKIEVQKLR